MSDRSEGSFHMLDRRTTAFIAYCVRTYPRRTALLVLLLILAGLSEGIGVLTIFPVIELAAGAGDAPTGATAAVARAVEAVGLPATLGVYLSLIVAGIFLKGGFTLLAMKQVGYTVSRVGKDLRLSTIRALLESRWAYFTHERAGGVANAISVEASQAAVAYRYACIGFAAVVHVFIYLGLAVLVSWKIALAGLVGGGLVVLLLGRLVAFNRSAARRQTELLRSLVARLADALQGMKALKAGSRERHLRPVLEREIDGFHDAQEQSVLASESMRAAQEPLLAVMLALLLYGAVTVGGQPLTAVFMIGFLFYRLSTYVGLTQQYYHAVTTNESGFWSIRERILSARAKQEPLRVGGVRPTLDDGIRIERVSFSYPDRPVLHDVDLTIPAGAITVFVGPSGSGKTTLLDLLVGLYDPDEGRVLIDGVPLTDVDLQAWRNGVGYVPQESLLFHDTVFHNIALGDPGLSESDAREALRTAGAWEFVEALPDGMETVVGERGSTLSGGQRQRIALARELARRPRLLLLDEVTASLDPATERDLCARLAMLRGSITIVAISHQEALTGLADVIVRFERGRASSDCVSRSGASAAHS